MTVDKKSQINQAYIYRGHLDSGDLVLYAASRACTIKLLEWYPGDFLLITLDQMGTIVPSIADEDFNSQLLLIIFILLLLKELSIDKYKI